MAVRIYIMREITVPNDGSSFIRYYVCDTDAEKPTSGLNEGDEVWTKDKKYFYVATSATTLQRVARTIYSVTGPPATVGDDDPPVAADALGMVDKTNQSGAISSANLAGTANVGEYVIYYELMGTTADNVTNPTVTLSVSYTDDGGAKTVYAAGVLLTSLPAGTSGMFSFYCASGVPSYAVNIDTALGNARYAVRVRTIFLG